MCNCTTTITSTSLPCCVFNRSERFALWLEKNINKDLNCPISTQGATVTGSTEALTVSSSEILYVVPLSLFTSNIDLDNSSVSVTNEPSNGTLTLESYDGLDLVFKYVPDTGFTGADTFTYWVYGNPPYNSVGDSATVNITVT